MEFDFDRECDRVIEYLAGRSVVFRTMNKIPAARVLEMSIKDLRLARNYGVPGQREKPRLVWTNPKISESQSTVEKPKI